MTWSVAALVMLAVALIARGPLQRGWQRRFAKSPHDQPPSVRPKEVPARASQPPEQPDPSPSKSCPLCLSEYPTRNRFCVNDGAELLEEPAAGPFAQGMICPTCRRGYPFDSSYCPEDADELVPYGLYGAASSTRAPLRLDAHKICPECGIRHASAHLFCGEDGTELVVVN